MVSARDPEWEPLLNFAPDHVVDFMWMYAVELTDGTRLQAYKHYWTRDYLHLDIAPPDPPRGVGEAL